MAEGLWEHEVLRQGAEKLIDWLERSLSAEHPVVHTSSPSDLSAHLPFNTISLDVADTDSAFAADEQPDPITAALSMLQQSLNHSVKASHPLFLNQLYAAPDRAGLLADWAVSTINANVHTFEAAPLFTVAERESIRKLCSVCGFDTGSCEGVFLPGTSLGNAYALHLGRHEHFPSVCTQGMCKALHEQAPCAFVGKHSHYSYGKVAALAGVGTHNIIAVEERESDGSMDPNDLRKKAQHARTVLGLSPFFVGATSGTTVKGSFDSLVELREVCNELGGLWLHTDAAWGGAVLFSPWQETKQLIAGIDKVDSAAFALHKLLGMPIQCSPLLVQRKGLLASANSSGASYLFQPDKLHPEQDMGDLTLGCGRRGDGFKLWFAWRLNGTARLQQRVAECEELAMELDAELRKRAGRFLRVFQRHFTTLCFWFVPPSIRENDAHIERLLNKQHAKAHTFENGDAHVATIRDVKGSTVEKHSRNHQDRSKWRSYACSDFIERQLIEYLLADANMKSRIGGITSTLKKRLQLSGDAVIAYQPLDDLPNFFRVAFTGAGVKSSTNAHYLLDLLEHHGSDL